MAVAERRGERRGWKGERVKYIYEHLLVGGLKEKKKRKKCEISLENVIFRF